MASDQPVRDPTHLLLQAYSKLYYFVKHRLHAGDLRGFGFVSRLARRDAILTVNDGARVFFDHRAAGNYACLLGGHYNEPETHLFVHRVLTGLAESCSFVDIGANIGEMIVDFARHDNIQQAIALEPSSLCCDIIARSCALNGLHNVSIVAKAVGERSGVGTMPRDPRFQCSTAVALDRSSGPEEMFDNVEVTTLDAEILNPKGLWIMLIDVEGGELAVMRGGRGFIRSTRPLIIFEYHEGTRGHFSLDEVCAELGQSYELLRLKSDGFLDHNLSQTWNCVAVPRTGPFRAPTSALARGDSCRRDRQESAT